MLSWLENKDLLPGAWNRSQSEEGDSSPLWDQPKGITHAALEINWDWAKDFKSLEQGLSVCPGPALPDITNPFHLYVDEAQGI